jgi:hypothetical protein
VDTTGYTPELWHGPAKCYQYVNVREGNIGVSLIIISHTSLSPRELCQRLPLLNSTSERTVVGTVLLKLYTLPRRFLSDPLQWPWKGWRRYNSPFCIIEAAGEAPRYNGVDLISRSKPQLIISLVY